MRERSAPIAERTPSRAAVRRSGQQENRNISAADQQQQSHCSEQQEQCSANSSNKLIVQTFESHAEVLREVARRLLRECSNSD